MEIHVLPTRTSDAAGNMATDFLLLRRYPTEDAVRWRHYLWRRPAFTFGYSQKIHDVRTRLAGKHSEDEPFDIARRPTGGGIVDHREDWTYALVVPRSHPLFERPGPVIYRLVHEALADVLNATGANVSLQRQPPESPPGVCFDRPELDDVVRADDHRKVAGAALKRAKCGLLLQGSIWKPHVGEANWDDFEQAFPNQLAKSLNCDLTEPGWPAFDPDEEEALTAQYASTEWTELR